ncbi:MAG: hypothetical protein GY703_16305 [Gammaproteobacteria bacterium]|nr:hypothetical protein [Gammaproteobacteria bacterium]
MKKADTDRSTVIRPPMAGRIGGAFATVWIGGLGIFMLGAVGVSIMDDHIGVAAFLVAIAGFTFILTRYVFRDVRAKWGWCIAVGADALDLDLPDGRSLIHRLDPVHRQISYEQIEVIETRLEAYRSFGMANMHRSYALKLKTGDLIVLGEDRALGTGMASTFFANTVEQIVQHGQLGVQDLGMVEGNGGVLSVLFTSPPPWDAPSLGAKNRAALWRRVAWTGALALIAVMVVLLAATYSSVPKLFSSHSITPNVWAPALPGHVVAARATMARSYSPPVYSDRPSPHFRTTEQRV